MNKHGWMLWLAPVAVWTVYMCWLTGFNSGYEAGHTDGWATARKVLMPQRTATGDRPTLVQREVPGDSDVDLSPRAQ